MQGGFFCTPGIYATNMLRNGPAVDLYFASLRFLDWWLDYEVWIARETPPDWRKENYRAFASLPASRVSLPPKEAIAWLRQYRRDPAKIDRVRERMRGMKKRG